jgi:hypothetical protein
MRVSAMPEAMATGMPPNMPVPLENLETSEEMSVIVVS